MNELEGAKFDPLIFSRITHRFTFSSNCVGTYGYKHHAGGDGSLFKGK